MEFRLCDDLGPSGFSWLADEPNTRTSHALAAGGDVWLIDPLDWPDAIDRAGQLGRPAAVIQLLDRHPRDCAALAGRLAVPHLVVPEALPATPFEVIEIRRWRHWREIALWWADARTLVVADALGTNAFFPVRGDRIGVHALLKPTPPRQLGRLEPEHVLVGHGPGIHGAGAAAEVRRALSRSRLSFFTWALTLPFKLRRQQP
jgi:hypothetical protein